MKTTIPIGLQPGTKLLQLRYEIDTRSWILWLWHDTQMRNGTYLRLDEDGGITRISLYPDGSEEHFTVKEGGYEVVLRQANDNHIMETHT